MSLTFKTIGTRPVRPDAHDKVTGKAAFGNDVTLPGSLTGLVLRSPHAHADIISIDTRAAEKLSGVKAVVTAADFPELRSGGAGDVACDNLARHKVLYHGHGVAAVAATSATIARKALQLIRVRYRKLPHVTDIEAAMAPDAPLLHAHLGYDGHEGPSNIYERMAVSQGDVSVGFAGADIVREREYRTPTIHQGYIEPPACLASYVPEGQSTIWTTTQGHFPVRDSVALMCAIDTANLRVIPTEIGGGFGGKTAVYLEAIALRLSQKSGQPVTMKMSRTEVFQCGGPGAGSINRVRIGIRRDGTITAMQAKMYYESGAFPAAPLGGGVRSIFSAYDVAHTDIEGFSVVVNKPKVRAYRGPGASQACFAVESLLNELAAEIGMDPIALRQRNAISDGGTNIGGSFRELGLHQCLTAARDSDHYRSELGSAPGKLRGRAVAAGFWRNGGGLSSASIHMHRNGFASVATGSADLSGTRIALAMIAAETLQIPVENVQIQVADTESVGFTGTAGGSRTVNATGQAVARAGHDIIEQLRERAASSWNVLPGQVEYADGEFHNSSREESVSLRELTRASYTTGGPVSASASASPAPGEGPCFAVHICDVEVDPETGQSKVIRYTTVQDAGVAVHPAYVEGQFQGGAVQGIGWALNEAFIYNRDGSLENPSFLDYRMPVTSDLPMIETVIVEVPNSAHPLGVRGVGEAPIIPPLAAVASAISQAVGEAITELPCSPMRVLKALESG